MKAVVRATLPNGAMSFGVTEDTFVRRMTDLAAAQLPLREAVWECHPLEEEEH